LSPRTYLESEHLSDLVRYRSGSDYRKTSAPFTGTPRKHPWETNKMILVAAPFSPLTIIYEFRYEDITHAEELPQIVNENGESVRMAKIWVKKGSLGMRLEPFQVDDLPRFLMDTDVLSVSNPPSTGGKKP
jgi:hypothetical protein